MADFFFSKTHRYKMHSCGSENSLLPQAGGDCALRYILLSKQQGKVH